MFFDIILSLIAVWFIILYQLLLAITPLIEFTHVDTVVSFLITTPLKYFSGIFDIETIVAAITVLASWFSSYYFLKFLLWAYGYVPFIGKKDVIEYHD